MRASQTATGVPVVGDAVRSVYHAPSDLHELNRNHRNDGCISVYKKSAIEKPDPTRLAAWRAAAEEFLRANLPKGSEVRFHEVAETAISPLEGEGCVAVWPVTALMGDERDSPVGLYVVGGETAPNYYPTYGLTVDEIVSLHVGTRFMLVVGAGQAEAARVSDYNAETDARRIVDRVAPRAAIEELEVAAAFQVEHELHVVLRCALQGERVYIMAADAPPGFSRRTDLPAPVVYRMHIGHVIRQEPEPGDEDA